MADPVVEAAARELFKTAVYSGYNDETKARMWMMQSSTYMDNARRALAAAYRAEAAILRAGSRPCRGCIYEWLEERAAEIDSQSDGGQTA